MRHLVNVGKTKPNKPKFKIGKMNATSFITMSYEQRAMNDEKNKPKQTQFPQRDTQYAIRDTKYKPKQSQFLYHWLRLLFIIAAVYKKGRYINSSPANRTTRYEIREYD